MQRVQRKTSRAYLHSILRLIRTSSQRGGMGAKRRSRSAEVPASRPACTRRDRAKGSVNCPEAYLEQLLSQQSRIRRRIEHRKFFQTVRTRSSRDSRGAACPGSNGKNIYLRFRRSMQFNVERRKRLFCSLRSGRFDSRSVRSRIGNDDRVQVEPRGL